MVHDCVLLWWLRARAPANPRSPQSGGLVLHFPAHDATASMPRLESGVAFRMALTPAGEAPEREDRPERRNDALPERMLPCISQCPLCSSTCTAALSDPTRLE
eukprot:1683713-Alexandrium_andersonii.AAC.1